MQVSIIFSEQPNVQHTVILQGILGQGKFCVYHARDLSTGNNFALKVFPKNPSANSYYIKEKQYLSTLNHPSIVTHLPIIQHSLHHDLLATEYTPNGDFFDFITNGGFKNEILMRTYFQQLIEGLEFIHERDIGHLDLKLENLLLDKEFCLRIMDFDQSQKTSERDIRSGGTVGYRAPELLKKEVKDFKALDVYAAGVILYVFITGQMPFIDVKPETARKSARYEYFRDERENFWKEKENELKMKFSQELKDLLGRMWEEDADKRIKVEEIKRTLWYSGEIYEKEEVESIVGLLYTH